MALPSLCPSSATYGHRYYRDFWLFRYEYTGSDDSRLGEVDCHYLCTRDHHPSVLDGPDS